MHELKLDGYRIQAHRQDGGTTLYTRSGFDWTKRFATVAADIGRLPADTLAIDGEIISADADGPPDFSALQDDLKRGRHDRFVVVGFAPEGPSGIAKLRLARREGDALIYVGRVLRLPDGQLPA